MIKTDILIIGAGPVGLFTVFEAGLLKLKCHLIDALPQIGGQLTELYPKKPIYDIPGYPTVDAADLVNNLMEQCKQFEPGFTLNETAERIVDLDMALDFDTGKGLRESVGYRWLVITNKGTKHYAKAIIIAGGLGTFLPRKPILEQLEFYEDKGVNFFLKDPEALRGKKVVICGGGDSALDWTIYLASIVEELTLVHRSGEFRGALDSLDKVHELKEQGKVKVITHAEVVALRGFPEGKLREIVVYEKLQGVFSGEATTPHTIQCDNLLMFFGLVPKLGAIGDWGLDIEKNAIVAKHPYYESSKEGIYAVGDVNTYEGKLKLILCGFHEATMAVQGIYNSLNPGKKFLLKYTTVSGVDGFDGTRKEAEKPVTKEI